jgi:uncharacterized protein involved in exopolysaccharide biosynthesis/cellulose biosynthesis protein BcsQ
MTISSRPDSFELGDYLGVLRRRWWIVLVLTCVGVLLAGAYAKVAPKTYTATVSVYVSPSIATGNSTTGRTNGSVNMDNEAQAVQSDSVGSLAQKALHSPLSTTALLKHVSVSVPPNTTVLQINCTAPTASGSAQCANEFGAAYLANRIATAVATATSQINALENSSKQLTRTVSDLKTKVKALPPNSPDQTSDQLQLTAAQEQLTQVNSELSADLPARGSEQQPGNNLAGYIENPAATPSTPTSPRKLLLLPSGLLAGLLIGLLIAFLLDRRDLRIHAARDVERYLDLPALLDVAQKKSGLSSPLASPRSKTGRAFTELAQYIAASLGEGNHVLLVAGTSAGAGGSVVAANLAATLARTRSDVVLVCADPRGTITPPLLAVSNGRGLSEILAGSATVSEVARRPAEISRLRVITPGVDTASAVLHLQHESIRRLVAELRQDARYVIIETNSVGEDADAFALSEFADAALLAVEVSGTSRPDAVNCVHRLDRLRIPVLGAAVLPALTRKLQARQGGPQQRAALPPRSAPAVPRLHDRPADQRAPADKSGPRAVPSTPPAASPAARVTDGKPEQDTAMAARGPAETWPLPRAAIPPRVDRPRRRADYQDPPDKAAGV